MKSFIKATLQGWMYIGIFFLAVSAPGYALIKATGYYSMMNKDMQGFPLVLFPSFLFGVFSILFLSMLVAIGYGIGSADSSGDPDDKRGAL